MPVGRTGQHPESGTLLHWGSIGIRFPTMLQLRNLFIFLLYSLAHANVEKVVFVAPPAESFPTDASIDNLLLTSLTGTAPSIRTHLNASFPTNQTPKGSETWMLLEGLTPASRYEVRICWLATVRIMLHPR